MITRLDIEAAGRLPSWSEIRMALDRGWISPDVAIQVAIESIESTQDTSRLVLLSELATARREQPIARLIDELATMETPAADGPATKFWANAALIALWERRDEYDDPLRAVAHLYCEFDHPRWSRLESEGCSCAREARRVRRSDGVAIG